MKKCISLFLTLSILFSLQINASATDDDLISNLTLSCDNTFSVFEADSIPTYTVSWENNGGSSSYELSATVIDYYDNAVFTKNDSVSSSDTSYTLTLSGLGVGHYRLNAKIGDCEASTSFAIVPAAEQRRDSKELPFGMAAMATREYKNSTTDMTYKDYVNTLSLAGIYNVRDYGLMREMENITNKPNDLYCWWVDVHYDPIINEYHDKGINLTFVYQNENPTETNVSSAYIRDNYYVPNDLIASYNFSKALAERYKGKIDAIEVFNEIDASWTQLGTDGPDAYAAFLKASALGIKDGDSDIKVVASSLCNGESSFRQRLFENDISPYINAENYHSYTTYSERHNNEKMQKYNDFPSNAYEQSKNYALSDKEVYVTEQGLAIKTDLNTTELSDELQKVQARYLATSAVESMTTNSDKNFWFKHGHQVERDGSFNKHFGDMAEDNTPYMSYSVVSALTNSLGNGKYIGKFKDLPDGQYGYIFKDGEYEIACLWSDDTAVAEVSASCTDAVLIDIMGNETPATFSNNRMSIETSRDIKYLRIKGSFDTSSYTYKTQSTKSLSSSVPNSGERVVLLQEFGDAACSDARVHGYNVEKGTVGKCKLHIYNFNDFTVSGTVWADIEGGYKLSKDEFKIDGIEPYSYATVTLDISSLDDIEALREYRLRFCGSFGGNACSDSVSYLYCNPKDDSDFIISDNTISGYNNPDNWKKNINSQSTWIASADGNEISFTHNFVGDDLWSMPYLTLPDNYSFANEQGIVFTYKGSKPLDGSKFYVYLSEAEDSGEIYVASQSATFDGSYGQCTIDFNSFYQTSTSGYENGVLDLDKIVDIRIGINHKTEGEFILSLKNIGTYSYNSLDGLYVKPPTFKKENNKLIVTTNVENYTDLPKSGVIIIALTDDDNKLIDIYTQKLTADATYVTKVSHDFAVGDDVENISIYFWKDLTGLIPLYRKTTSDISTAKS